MAVFIMGDTHFGAGVRDEEKLLCLSAKPEDFAIICGDAGFVWYGDDVAGGRDYLVLEQINALGFTVCFIDGNHENHAALNTYPVVEFHGGKAHKLRDNVYHLMRGEIFEFEGKTYWTFGGAASVDKFRRTEGKSWWPEEVPSNEEIMYGFDKVMAAGKVDYILTHQIPQFVKEDLFYYFTDLEDLHMAKMFNEVYNNVEFKHWYTGHLHIDRKWDKVRILYNDIITIN